MTAAGTREIRVAGIGDAATLARLLHDFNVEFEAPTDSPPVLEHRFARILQDPSVLAVLATNGADPTGFALITLRPTIWFDGPAAALDELYVVPGRRNEGRGTDLLTHACEVLRGRGCPELHINVDEVDLDARRFYERHGFVNVEPGTDWRMLFYTGSTDLTQVRP